MADVKNYPPRQKKVFIECHYKDLASLLFQSANDTEVLTFLTNDQLSHVIFQLQTEQQGRDINADNAKTKPI